MAREVLRLVVEDHRDVARQAAVAVGLVEQSTTASAVASDDLASTLKSLE